MTPSVHAGALLFDNDGVLVDSDEPVHDACVVFEDSPPGVAAARAARVVALAPGGFTARR